MARYCLLCGSGNDERTIFCSACGTELVENEVDEIEDDISHVTTPVMDRVPAPDGTVDGEENPLMVLPDGTLLKNTYQLTYLTCGGMGAIYKAIDLEVQKECIIKEAVSTDPTEKSRLMMALSREREALIRLVHPGIIKCHDFFEEGDSWYLVLEYFDGQTLAEIQEAIKPGFLAEIDVLSWTVQLAEILDYLHKLNPPVIYRDLKPSNVMVNHLGKIKLIDFGIARIHKKGRRDDTVVMGTVGFCPPEQYGDGQTDHCSDIYSLGAMIHSLLTNIMPGTQSSNPFEFSPMRMINPNVSRQLEAIVKKATRIDRDQRYESMEQMLVFLNNTYNTVADQCLGMPKLEVDPASLDLMRIAIDEKRTARFLVTNAGKGNLAGNITIPSMKGFSVYPLTINSNKRVVEIEVDGALTPPYKQQKVNIIIKTNGGNTVLPVNFSVGLTPKIVVTPASMQFVLQNDQISFPKELVLLNKGADILEGVVRVKDFWIILGTKEFKGNFMKIPVQIEPYNLFPGRSYNTKIVVNTNGGTREIPVSVFFKLSYTFLEDTLAHIPQGREKVQLSQMLRDMRVLEPKERKEIIIKLSKSKYKELFVTHFMEAMERDHDMEVRETVAEILFSIARQQAVPSFLEGLGDVSPKIRRISADVLGEFGDGDAIEYILKLVTDSNSEVRQAARRALAKLGPKKAASITKAVKEFDIQKATKSLQGVHSAAKGIWDKFMSGPKKENK